MSRSNDMSKLIGGGLLILFGAIWLAANFIPGFNINWGAVWPLFMVIPGLYFWAKYLLSNDRVGSAGVLVPGTLLVFLGLTFYFNMFATDTLNIDNVWLFTAFMYPGSVAIAFWTAWVASKREVAFLVPAVILTGISTLVFCAVSGVALIGGQATADINKLTWPLIIIGIGFFVIVSPLWSGAIFKNSRFMGKTKEEWQNWGKDLEQKMDSAFEEQPEKKQDNKDEIDVSKAEEAELVDSEKIS